MLVIVILLPLCFFFSSRRRHTRSKRDWSSDVCSSDLNQGVRVELAQLAARVQRVRLGYVAKFNHAYSPLSRSEERRVGKECRSGRSRSQVRKIKKLTKQCSDQWSDRRIRLYR